jgi:mono/diheme cytochrome c family protein
MPVPAERRRADSVGSAAVSVLALTTGQKTGILVVAAIFIVFALVSSFLLPRRNPDFPGSRGVLFFTVVSVALFVAMLTAMVTLAKEDAEAEGHGSAAAGEVDTTEGEPSGGAEDTVAGETQPPGAAEGDPEAGADVFASAGCGACHTLADAGATGSIGPNLDESQPDYQLALDRVTNGAGAMPAFKDQLSEPEIENVSAYVVASAGS